MKKTLLFVAALAMTLCASAQVETVSWTAAEVITADKTYGSIILRPGADKNFTVDANKAYFYDGALADATLENSTAYEFRAKAGGKSNVSKGERLIILNATKPGVLKLAMRTGSNSEVNRNVLVTQGATELFNKIMLESDSKEVDNPDNPANPIKIYEYQTINIPATGEVIISFPTNSINTYAIIWAPEGSISIEEADADKGAIISSVSYDALGRKVANDAKGLVIKKVTYENGSTETLKLMVK